MLARAWLQVCVGCRRALLRLQACERVSTALRHMPEFEFQKRMVPARGKGGGIGDLARRLARAPEAVAGRPAAPTSPPWECCAAQSRQARPEEAQGASSGGTLPKVAALVVLVRVRRPVSYVRLSSSATSITGGLICSPG